MKKIIVFMSIGFSLSAYSQKEYCSPILLNAEIQNTLEERQRQKDMQTQQNQNTIIEVNNQHEWRKFTEMKQKIQNRLRMVDFAMQSIPTGYVIFTLSEQIKENEVNLYKEVRDLPATIVVALPAQYKFVDDLQMVTRLLIGIVASYGAINQMEQKERQFLLDFARSEVTALKITSGQTLRAVRQLKEAIEWKKLTLAYYKNRDKGIVQDIIKQAKSF